jgi:hypothetical protein
MLQQASSSSRRCVSGNSFRTVRKSGKLSAACGKAENFPQAEKFPAQGWKLSASFLAIEELGELASAKKLIMNNR